MHSRLLLGPAGANGLVILRVLPVGTFAGNEHERGPHPSYWGASRNHGERTFRRGVDGVH